MKEQRGELAVLGMTRNTQRSSLGVDIIDHYLPVRCPCYNFFAICRESNTPYLHISEMSEKCMFRELVQTYSSSVVSSPFPRVGKIKLNMLLIELICIEHMHIRSDGGINHPTDS